MDWFTNTLEYRGWYWCWATNKPRPSAHPDILHLINLPIYREPRSLCQHEFGWIELHMTREPSEHSRICPPPSSYQCVDCAERFMGLVWRNLIGHDAIPAEYQIE